MLMDKVIKLGVVGGNIESAVGYAHFVATKMDNRFKYEAGCFSRRDDINQKTAKVYGVDSTHIYSSLDDMLEHEKSNIDAILILTPTPNHYENIMLCLDADIPVICEKSVTLNYLQAKTILEKVRTKNSFLNLTYNYVGYPAVREIKDMIENGELGKILHFQIEMPQEGYLRTDDKGNKMIPQDWRLIKNNLPLIYLDLASHMHHLISYVMDKKTKKVIAIEKSGGWFEGVIDNVQCLVEYEDNIQGSMWFSKSSLGYRNGLKVRIFGKKASVEWMQMNPEEIMVSYNDGTRKIVDRASSVQIENQRRYNRFKAGHPAGYVEAFANVYTDIYDNLIHYLDTNDIVKSKYNIDTALEGMMFLENMQKSVVSGRWEEICII